MAAPPAREKMRILIIAVGKTKDPATAELVRRYEKRLLRAARLQWVETPAAPGKGERAAALAQEALAIRAQVPARAYVVALSERGRELDSKGFAAWLGKQRDQGRELCFLIGGPDGLDPALIKEAHETISLSRLTFPHELVRVLLAEQLYRGFSILQGEPYHRE